MRLTNFLRDAFINAAMQDVPKIDMTGEAHVWLEKCTVKMPSNLSNIYSICPNYEYIHSKAPEVWKQLEALAKLHDEQYKKRGELKSRLQGVANACNTRKQLLEALPEFEAYLPAEEAKAAKNLPALANVLSDFVKAGWPKNQPKMPKAATP